MTLYDFVTQWLRPDCNAAVTDAELFTMARSAIAELVHESASQIAEYALTTNGSTNYPLPLDYEGVAYVRPAGTPNPEEVLPGYAYGECYWDLDSLCRPRIVVPTDNPSAPLSLVIGVYPAVQYIGANDRIPMPDRFCSLALRPRVMQMVEERSEGNSVYWKREVEQGRSAWVAWRNSQSSRTSRDAGANDVQLGAM